MEFHPQRLILAFLLLSLTAHGEGSQTATSVQDSNCTLTANPDISGVGVRISFYLQGLIVIFGPLIFDTDTDAVEIAFRNAFLTAASLTMSTFVYARTPGSLSLADGLIVTLMTDFLVWAPLLHIHTVVGTKRKPSRFLLFTYIFGTILTGLHGLVVWIHIDTYAAIPRCNPNSSMKLVLLGCPLPATSRGLRGFAIW